MTVSVTDSQKQPDLVTTREAADFLRVHPRTIARYTAAGRLPVVMLSSRTRRFHRADIETLAERAS